MSTRIDRRRGILKRALLYGLVLVAVLYIVTPFVYMVTTSFMEQREAGKAHWIPRHPTLKNYRAYVAPDPEIRDVGYATARDFFPSVVNSLIIAAVVTAFNLVLGSFAAYGIARIQTRSGFYMLLFYLGSRSIPGVAIMIPMYILMQKVGLLDTKLAVILAHISFTLPFTIWLLNGYFQTVPADIEHAAWMDGCGRLNALLRVFLPCAFPGIVAAGIFCFVFSWGEFLFTLLFTTTMHSKTVTVVTSEFVGELAMRFPLVAAGGVLSVLLPLVLAFIFQRFIIRGIGGAVTG